MANLRCLEVTVENEQHISDIELVIHEKGRVHGTVSGLLDGESASVEVAENRWGGVQSDGNVRSIMVFQLASI